jgi:hypothetical protein
MVCGAGGGGNGLDLSLLALALKGGEKKLPYLDYETWCLVKGALACLELRLPYLPLVAAAGHTLVHQNLVAVVHTLGAAVHSPVVHLVVEVHNLVEAVRTLAVAVQNLEAQADQLGALGVFQEHSHLPLWKRDELHRLPLEVPTVTYLPKISA